MPRKNPPDDNKPLSVAQARGKVARAMRDLTAGHDPGPVTFRLKRTRKADETYPLRLTRQQRESMIRATRIKNKVKERLRQAGDDSQVIGFTLKELDHLNDEIGQAALYAPGPDKRQLVTVLRRVSDLLAEEHAGVFEGIVPTTRKTAPKAGDLVYQFKVTLLDVKPAVWRRIRVPDGTLADLHGYIQAAFGWWDYHLHQFDIDGERYGPLAPDDMDFGLEAIDETGVTLGRLIPKSGRKPRWVYEYDFGDGWRHEVLFEGFVTADPKAKYPQCVEGERARPPEDCGGPWGYADYLAAIRDPGHDRHGEMLGWRRPFDPEAFDAKKATKDMFPWFEFSDAVSEFQQALYDNGWVAPSFDWGEWQDAAREYVERPEKIGSADAAVVQNLLTTHVRKERFCEGHLAAMFENGHVVALLRRSRRSGRT